MAKKKNDFQITLNEWIFVALIGIFGFLSYLKHWLVFLNTLNPLLNFLIYYVIWFVLILILSITGFAMFGSKIKNPIQIIGTLLILFSIGVIIGWSNNYVTYATTGSFSSSMNIYFGCEDGVSWWIFYDLLNIHNILLAKILAFSVFPMITSTIGVLLIKRVKFSIW
jgi:hypothetical protein